VYDQASNRLIAFGGGTTSGTDNDVWVLDNANGLSGTPHWTELFPGGSLPHPRYSMSAVLNPGINRMIIFGGECYSDNRTRYNDTWVLALNRKPVANAGTSQTVHAGSLVTLDGSGSADPDGNLPLTYKWRFVSKPATSTATLSDDSIVNPTFVADTWGAGDWVVELVVTDDLGAKSAPVTVTFSTSNSAPTAAAGEDQAIIEVGSIVNLNGTESWDNDDPTTSLIFAWNFTDWPGKGGDPPLPSPTLSDSASQTPSFRADTHGTYKVQLTVTDPWSANSSDEVIISFSNVKPVANAGTNQSVLIGPPVVLDGSGSSDANRDLLTHQWALTEPQDSVAILINPTSKNPSFTPDVPGIYVAQLIVNDGFDDSDPSTVTISVAATRSWVTDQIRNVITDLGNIDLLPDAAFKNKNLRNTLITKLAVVINMVDAGNYAGALAKLQEDVISKTDGCATSTTPDNNDWIINCIYQGMIYPELMDLVGHITELANQP
jgi:hypothetical protein